MPTPVTGMGITGTDRLFETATGSITHAASLVITQLTTSELAGVVIVNVVSPDPTPALTFPPFSFHWYNGVAPPSTVDAVNTATLPAQTYGAELTVTVGAGNGMILTSCGREATLQEVIPALLGCATAIR